MTGRGDREVRISLVVVTTGASGSLGPCLERLRPQVEKEAAELLLVVNCPENAISDARRREFAAACDALVFEPTAGKSRALNRGIAASRGEVVAFTDDDTLPEPDWLREICAPLLEGDLELAGCGGRVIPVFPETGSKAWFEALVLRKQASFLGPRHDLGSYDRSYIFNPDRRTLPIGANCAFRREVLTRYPYNRRLGPNRETGGRGGEDSELGLRILRDGFSLRYCANAVVRHPVAPERMTREYVEEGYFTSGVERIRVTRALGLPLPSPWRIRSNWLFGLPRQLLARVRGLASSGGPTHGELKQYYRRGLLAELSRRESNK